MGSLKLKSLYSLRLLIQASAGTTISADVVLFRLQPTAFVTVSIR